MWLLPWRVYQWQAQTLISLHKWQQNITAGDNHCGGVLNTVCGCAAGNDGMCAERKSGSKCTIPVHLIYNYEWNIMRRGGTALTCDWWWCVIHRSNSKVQENWRYSLDGGCLSMSSCEIAFSSHLLGSCLPFITLLPAGTLLPLLTQAKVGQQNHFIPELSLAQSHR